MTKPVIIKREVKGQALSYAELDQNFQNLDDATISIGVSGGNTVVNDLNGTTTLVPSDEIFLTADNTAKTITVSEKIIRLYAYVHNAQGATISKGQPVYLYQATGDKPSVKLANNTSDATSAKVLGLAAETLTTGADGYVITQGKLVGVNTSAFAEGDTLYLGATDGSLTATKPYAPNHLVYIGVVAKANAGQGEIYVRPQNGYELDELHNVNIDHNVALANGHTLVYNSSNQLWENQNASYSLPTASATVLGGIKVGSGLSINGSGVLSATGGTPSLFSAYSANSTTWSGAGWDLITLDGEEYDTDNYFDSTTFYRFKPTVAGYYQIIGRLGTNSTSAQVALWKTGSGYKYGTTGANPTISTIVYFNGSSDYIQLYGTNFGTTNTSLSQGSRLEGYFIRS